MIDYEALRRQGQQAGFTHVAPLKVSTIQLLPEVRDMCATNSCGAYGQKWSCPPGCGTLEECRQRLQGYTEGILVQTVGELEDEMDGETMMETERRHKATFYRFLDELLPQYPGLLALGWMPRAVGIGGWSLVGLGFLAVALVALLGPRSRLSRPSLRPFRPPALFSMAFFRRGRKP